ncbi:cholesterol 7-desaturase nvd [Phymastichus coffea]|uniref:cholesterol 7-desaturase nvd n=1 Tax=Phymastichus coffea TaxID=108790 RepID=UPI00273B82DB|nr:cholesterol 7-desaturase nvd [Phymastichus coffea]
MARHADSPSADLVRMMLVGFAVAATAAAAAAFGILVFVGFFWKMNWVQKLATGPSRATSRRGQSRKIGQLPPVYPNGWFALLESSSLRKGQVEHVSALGQNFAVFRTESGIVRIINAYCPHLGANMAEGGEVKGEELECPFHSWRFCGETGKCTSIPYSKNVPSAVRTKVWESSESNGLIFVWHHAESAAPDWYPKPIEGISNGTWRYQGRNEFYINCHIQEIPENGADWAHLEAVHGASMLNVGFMAKVMRHSWTNASWSSPTTTLLHADKEASEQHVATSCLRHSVILFDKFSLLEMDVVALQIGPAYVELHLRTAFGPICIIQSVTPVEPLLQKVTHLVFAPVFAAPCSKIILIGESLMFKRDVRVWNHKKFMENPMLVNEDTNIKKYRRWYKQFYSENSPTYESCKNSLDW